MIDTLVKMLPRAKQRPILDELGLRPREYLLVTLHRPSNVDDPERLGEVLRALVEIAQGIPVVFPVHPRTREKIGDQQIALAPSQMRLIEPLGYLEFLALTCASQLVITDSGGVQEETTYLGVPCLTARANTERPVTIQQGTNRLVASRYQDLIDAIRSRLQEPHEDRHPKPDLWDGKAAVRIAQIMTKTGSSI